MDRKGKRGQDFPKIHSTDLWDKQYIIREKRSVRAHGSLHGALADMT
jgi:hypothetical protein